MRSQEIGKDSRDVALLEAGPERWPSGVVALIVALSPSVLVLAALRLDSYYSIGGLVLSFVAGFALGGVLGFARARDVARDAVLAGAITLCAAWVFLYFTNLRWSLGVPVIVVGGLVLAAFALGGAALMRSVAGRCRSSLVRPAGVISLCVAVLQALLTLPRALARHPLAADDLVGLAALVVPAGFLAMGVALLLRPIPPVPR